MNSYYYFLPKELIALKPAVPRDNSRLFIYNTKSDTINLDAFANVSNYLPSQTLIVLNATKVQPSRITLLKKSTGGKVTVLVLLNEKTENSIFSLMIDRKVNMGEILVHKSRQIFEITEHRSDSIFYARLLISYSDLILLLGDSGTMPIPLYLRKTDLTKTELKEKYQTVFASNDSLEGNKEDVVLGSVAAPTASLHFTDEVFKSLNDKNIEKAYIKLEVGLGTFAPLTEDNLKKNSLHKEWYKIKKEEKTKIIEAKKCSKKILACGTTVVRTLESWGGANENGDDYVSTNIFIRPGYTFKMVDMMLTNFHLPGSSLMMLVEAFLQSKNASKSLTSLYEIAVKERFRFFSFGDAMLIL